MTEKKVITKPIDYDIINQLSTDFETRFVPQTELSAEQAFWSQYSVQTDEPKLSASTTIVEVLKELPKVSMGTWGFEHTKACFHDDIIPFVKALKKLFTSFDQCLIDEVTEVQNVFKQMKLAVEQHCKEKNKFQNKMEKFLQENDRLLTQALSVEIINVVVHDNVNSACLNVDVCAHCAQQLKPKLYDGRIIEKSDAVVIPDTEETLMLAEESHSKMIKKQKDQKMTEKKVITKPIDYAIINQLSTDFETRFVPQTELSVEQAFWSQYSVQTDELNLSATTTIVEVPKELPKVSMVNSCLKKLKFHLASFDMVVKERTTATAITEGVWGFEYTKACFRDDIIPFVKALKELFTSFDQCLIDEVTEVQNAFKQMELAVKQHREEKNKFQNKMENVLQENDRLLTQSLSVEIMNVVVHDNVKSACLNMDVCAHCVTIESELKKDFIKKECYEMNDHVAKIMSYGDYQIGNVTISQVYYVEGLGYNLFSVGQFYDSDLEVAFRQHTCFIRNLDGVDLLTGSRGNSLYTLSIQDMMASFPICLLSKASKTKVMALASSLVTSELWCYKSSS
nr:retrovirus-related Pol polyprotein from transposon TNT 1-94 [Tanacetum cinerariifolium]